MLQNSFYIPFIRRKKKDNVHPYQSRWRVRGDQRPQSGHCTLSQPARICRGTYRYVSHYNNKGITFVAKHPFDRDSLIVWISKDITYCIVKINITDLSNK